MRVNTRILAILLVKRRGIDMVQLRMESMELTSVQLAGHLLSRAFMMRNFIQGKDWILPPMMLVDDDLQVVISERYTIERNAAEQIQFMVKNNAYGDEERIFYVEEGGRGMSRLEFIEMLQERLGDDFDKMQEEKRWLCK